MVVRRRAAGSPRSRANRSNAAISTVHAPESSSSIRERLPPGPTRDTARRRARGTPSPLLGIDVERVGPGTPGTRAARPTAEAPSTSSRFEAGSVLTRRRGAPVGQRYGDSAGERRLPDATPLPVKKRNRVGASRSRRPAEAGRADLSHQQPDPFAGRSRQTCGSESEAGAASGASYARPAPGSQLLTGRGSSPAHLGAVNEDDGQGAGPAPTLLRISSTVAFIVNASGSCARL